MLRRLTLLFAVAVLALAGGACEDDGTTFGSSTTAGTTTTAPATTTSAATTTSTTEPPVRVASLMVPASAFIPATDGVVYYNNGSDLRIAGNSLAFYAPVWLPVPEVRVEKFTIIAYDNVPGADLCVSLEVNGPLENTDERLGEICTGTGPVLPQIRELADLDHREVDTSHQALSVYAYFSGPDVFLGGVQITYSY